VSIFPRGKSDHYMIIYTTKEFMSSHHIPSYSAHSIMGARTRGVASTRGYLSMPYTELNKVAVLCSGIRNRGIVLWKIEAMTYRIIGGVRLKSANVESKAFHEGLCCEVVNCLRHHVAAWTVAAI